jgi:hypothetical protein
LLPYILLLFLLYIHNFLFSFHDFLFFILLKPSGYCIYHLLEHTKTLRSTDRVCLCVPYGSHNKQRFFPWTALTDWAL